MMNNYNIVIICFKTVHYLYCLSFSNKKLSFENDIKVFNLKIQNE